MLTPKGKAGEQRAGFVVSGQSRGSSLVQHLYTMTTEENNYSWCGFKMSRQLNRVKE